MARAAQQHKQHDEDPLAEARAALKIAIEESQTAMARTTGLADAVERSGFQLAEIDAALKALASLDDEIAQAEADAIVRGVEFKLSPKMGEKLNRKAQLQTRRLALAAAADKIRIEFNAATSSARFAEANVIEAEKPLTMAESEMIAAEI
jgi:hypothetical protein